MIYTYIYIHSPILKSSWLPSGRWPPAAFFQEINIFWFFGHAHLFKKCIFLKSDDFFQKWLPRPNHYAHMKGIEILCKTPVRMFRDVPSESNSIGTNSKYSSPARMSTWTSRWRRRRRRRRRRPNNSPHLVRPLEYHVQGPNIPCGRIPHFDYTLWTVHVWPFLYKFDTPNIRWTTDSTKSKNKTLEHNMIALV